MLLSVHCTEFYFLTLHVSVHHTVLNACKGAKIKNSSLLAVVDISTPVSFHVNDGPDDLPPVLST